jgi:osmotically-inducible protein OsmY
MTAHAGGAQALVRVHGPKESVMPTHQNIVKEIRARLDGDPRIHNPREVAVSERAGAVILRGTVRSIHQRRAVADIAWSVPGVLTVEVELRVDPRDHWQDDELRGAALQAIISDDRVSAERVDVGVASGWLTLRGTVKRQSESDAAFEAVSTLAGVGGITNRIEVVTAGLGG